MQASHVIVVSENLLGMIHMSDHVSNVNNVYLLVR